MEAKIAHLGFIQGIVTRMGGNSFLLKGWSVSMVVAIFALAPKDADKRFLLIAYVPILMFWLLDAFFLHQERLFRHLFDAVANDRISSDRFTLDTTSIRLEVGHFLAWTTSKAVLPFHLGLAAMVLFAIFVLAKGVPVAA